MRRLFRFLAPYLKRHVGWIGVALVSVPLFGLCSVGLVSLIEPVFGEVLLADNSLGDEMPMLQGLGGGEHAEQTEPDDAGFSLNLKTLSERGYLAAKRLLRINDDNVLYFTPFLYVTLLMMRGLANFLSGYSFQRIGLGVTNAVRNDLYRKLLGQGARFHQQHSSGELISRAINDVTTMQTAVTDKLIDFAQQSITLLFLLYLLLSTDLTLALGCLVALPLIVFPIVRFGKGMRRTSTKTQQRMAEVTGLLSEGVRGHRVVKAFDAEDYESARFADATGRHMRFSLREQLLTRLSSPVIESVASIALAAFMIYAGLKIRSGELSPPLLIQFLANLMLMSDPIRRLNRVNLTLQQASAAGRRVEALLNAPNDIVEKPGAASLQGVREGVRFESVTFAYGDQPVLNDVNLEVRKGEIVALVGPSGAGKSSLVNLLPRFWDPDSGRVAVDGVDVRDVTLPSLRQVVGIVSQETTLFNDTVRANVAYGQPEIPLERVQQAVRAAYAADFVEALPHGYDTVIGEGGLQLSGGQRQRLAIARAILKNAPILILDEATSQLDAESEALVQKALDNLIHDRTTLVIAHRLATVIQATKIVVMEAGRITEQGTHEELLQQRGTYRRLFDLQFRQADTA